MRNSLRTLICVLFFALALPCGLFAPTAVQADPSGRLAPDALRIKGEVGVITIACVGDSITAGVGASAPANDYPSQLSYLLGIGVNVDNFGESGSTLLKNGDSPYWKRPSFPTSAASSPNIVVIMLGTNDSKAWNWVHEADFVGDYSALIDYYAKLPSHPKIFICSPPPVPGAGAYGINEPNVEAEIPLIKLVAAQKKVSCIDVHSLMPNDPRYYIDDVHPNDIGYEYLASAIYIGLTDSPAILPISNSTFLGPIQVHMIAPISTADVRYTIDGSDPNKNSAICTGTVTVNAPVVVKARAFIGSKPYGLITSTSYFSVKPQ